MIEFSEIVTKANKLYTLPDICLQLNNLVSRGDSSIEDIANLVSYDPALAFRVLKLANSALYSTGGSIETIEQAIQKVGTDELCNIAIAASAALVFKGSGKNKINLKDYWQHSVQCAVLTRELYLAKTGKKSGSMFVAGLLHNIGFLIILERLPYYMVKLTDIVGEQHKDRGFEQLELGFTFSELSSEMLKRWNLSEELIDVVANQYSPELSKHYNLNCECMMAAIRISDYMFEKSLNIASNNRQELPIVEHLDIDEEQLQVIIKNSVATIHSIVEIIQG